MEQSQSSQTLIEKVLRSEKLAPFCRYWAAMLMLAALLPMLGPERIWFLTAPPFFLLVLNAYLLIVLYIQTKRNLLDEKSQAVPKFFVYAVNSFLLFCMLPIAALILIPGALAEMGATLIMPFTTATLFASLAIMIACFVLTALGAALSVIQGRSYWEQPDDSDEDAEE